MYKDRVNAFTSYQKVSKQMSDTSQQLLETYRHVRIEDLPSYSKSEVDLELLNSQTFLTISADPGKTDSHRAPISSEREDQSRKPRKNLFKECNSGE